jgi:predicted flap endonuclease-1-like 5' DNA nuclease
MWTVAEANIIPIALALLFGLIAGWWMFRRSRPAPPRPVLDEPRPSDRVSAPSRGPEGKDLGDHAAAATADVAGEILGVDAHPVGAGPSGPPDNLQMLKGVGPRLAAQLNQNGITRFEQLATLSGNEVAILDERMGAFRGRIARDRLVEQACYLARDDRDGFETLFGKLGEAG